MSRKGELSRVEIDRNWPYQVATEATVGTGYNIVHGFCKDLSLCPRRYSFQRDGAWMNVFCFAEKEHADRFRDRFAGEMIDPEKRPRWPGRNR